MVVSGSNTSLPPCSVLCFFVGIGALCLLSHRYTPKGVYQEVGEANQALTEMLRENLEAKGFRQYLL